MKILASVENLYKYKLRSTERRKDTSLPHSFVVVEEGASLVTVFHNTFSL